LLCAEAPITGACHECASTSVNTQQCLAVVGSVQVVGEHALSLDGGHQNDLTRTFTVHVWLSTLRKATIGAQIWDGRVVPWGGPTVLS